MRTWKIFVTLALACLSTRQGITEATVAKNVVIITMDGLRCDSAEASGAVIRAVFQSEPSMSSAHSIVSMNAAAALFISGNADDLTTATQMAAESISEGRARGKLDALAEATRR